MSMSSPNIAPTVAAAFLNGIVVGIGIAALWAQCSGLVEFGPFFFIFLCVGLVLAAGIASLPMWISDRMLLRRRMSVLAEQRRKAAETGHAEQSLAAESR
jgi:hypothetical protein